MTTIVKPDVPGTVIRFGGGSIVQIEPSSAETVAIPLVHDWGPIYSDPPGVKGDAGGLQELTSFAAWTSLFGDSDTPGRTAVAGAFAGQGLPGAPGAGAVIVARMAGAAALAATIVIQNTTPAAALTLTGKYKGSRANAFTYTLDSDPANVARDRLRLYYQGGLQETYLYTKTDVAGLAALINLQSKMVTATMAITGVELTDTTVPVALAGGNDGATLVSSDHVNALNALDLQPFSILAPYNLTDSSLLASYVSWIQSQELANRPVVLVCGGAAGEAITDAVTRTVACADPHVVNFGVGTYHDDLLNKDLSTAQLAPRIAGIIAARGDEHALTYCKIGGLHPVGSTAPSSDDVHTAVTSGVVALMGASAVDADVRVAKGVTTFTSAADVNRPLAVFSDIRLVRIMDIYIRSMKEWGDDTVIGDLPVNDDTRALVRGHARVMQDDLLRRGLILPGDGAQIPKPFVVCVDPGDPNLRDAIPYTFGWQFAMTANAILGQGQVI